MPANLDPDAALMLRVKQGDTAAFTELVEKYKQPITNLIYRTLQDATEADEDESEFRRLGCLGRGHLL